jgi:class 3 adenylate cyclase
LPAELRRKRQLELSVQHAVALAKRMETLARPGGIYLTEHTAALIDRVLSDTLAGDGRGVERHRGW